MTNLRIVSCVLIILLVLTSVHSTEISSEALGGNHANTSYHQIDHWSAVVMNIGPDGKSANGSSSGGPTKMPSVSAGSPSSSSAGSNNSGGNYSGSSDSSSSGLSSESDSSSNRSSSSSGLSSESGSSSSSSSSSSYNLSISPIQTSNNSSNHSTELPSITSEQSESSRGTETQLGSFRSIASESIEMAQSDSNSRSNDQGNSDNISKTVESNVWTTQSGPDSLAGPVEESSASAQNSTKSSSSQTSLNNETSSVVPDLTAYSTQAQTGKSINFLSETTTNTRIPSDEYDTESSSTDGQPYSTGTDMETPLKMYTQGQTIPTSEATSLNNTSLEDSRYSYTYTLANTENSILASSSSKSSNRTGDINISEAFREYDSSIDRRIISPNATSIMQLAFVEDITALAAFALTTDVASLLRVWHQASLPLNDQMYNDIDSITTTGEFISSQPPQLILLTKDQIDGIFDHTNGTLKGYFNDSTVKQLVIALKSCTRGFLFLRFRPLISINANNWSAQATSLVSRCRDPGAIEIYVHEGSIAGEFLPGKKTQDNIDFFYFFITRWLRQATFNSLGLCAA